MAVTGERQSLLGYLPQHPRVVLQSGRVLLLPVNGLDLPGSLCSSSVLHALSSSLRVSGCGLREALTLFLRPRPPFLSYYFPGAVCHHWVTRTIRNMLSNSSRGACLLAEAERPLPFGVIVTGGVSLQLYLSGCVAACCRVEVCCPTCLRGVWPLVKCLSVLICVFIQKRPCSETLVTW